MEGERQRAGEKTAGNLKADKGREMAARESKTVGNTAEQRSRGRKAAGKRGGYICGQKTGERGKDGAGWKAGSGETAVSCFRSVRRMPVFECAL